MAIFFYVLHWCSEESNNENLSKIGTIFAIMFKQEQQLTIIFGGFDEKGSDA